MRFHRAILCLFFLVACSSRRAEVRVGSKKFTESVILGEIVTQLLESSGISSRHLRQLGSTQILWHALAAGEIDVYPEYTGTIRNDLLKLPQSDEGALRQILASRGLSVTRGLGFNNTYGIGMKKERAEQLGIAAISDLRQHLELRFGVTEEFLHRSDGWPAIQARYQLPQTHLRTLDHDLAYRALAEGWIDAMDVYSTDAEIPLHGLIVLTDDLRAFTEYQAVLLFRSELATKFPASASALAALDNRISEAEMRRLNGRVKLEKVPESEAAAEFLESVLKIPKRSSSAQGRWQRIGQYTVEHLLLVAVSLGVAIAVAIPLGILSARRRRIGNLILGISGVIQTVPSLALLVFMIPVLGIGTLPALAALFLYSVLPIVRNTAAGLATIPTSLLESAEVLGLPPLARLLKIELPLASPAIFAGIQTSAVINVGTATLGALIGAGGLGQPIITGIRLDDLTLILEGALPAAFLALAVQAMFGGLGRVLIPKGLQLKPDSD